MNKELIAAMLAFASLGKEIPNDSVRWLLHQHYSGVVYTVDDAMISLMLQSDEYYKHEELFKSEGLLWYNTIKDLSDDEIGEKYPEVFVTYLKTSGELGIYSKDQADALKK